MNDSPQKPKEVPVPPSLSILAQSTASGDVKALVELAECQAQAADYWFRKMWGQYLWLTGIGWTLSAVVPFGLATLLFLPSQNIQLIINIVLLLASAAALSCLVLASVMRLRERAIRSRRIRNQLLLAVRGYWMNVISPEELFAKVTSIFQEDQEEDAP